MQLVHGVNQKNRFNGDSDPIPIVHLSESFKKNDSFVNCTSLGDECQCKKLREKEKAVFLIEKRIPLRDQCETQTSEDGRVSVSVSFFQDELASTIEHAVKAALHTVLCAITKAVGSKFTEFRVEMAGKEKENESLKLRLEISESELKAVRGCINAADADIKQHLIFQELACVKDEEVPQQECVPIKEEFIEQECVPIAEELPHENHVCTLEENNKLGSNLCDDSPSECELGFREEKKWEWIPPITTDFLT
ncbi:UNVERIFIED_CONTAM: hypothetical protein FKN15_023171 [Acipenser sinensis]